MTVANEFLKDNQNIEYVICIEGIGWPSDYGDLTQGFDGTVFVTNDIDGTFASDMGCTIKYGLELPRSISDSFDPKTYDYTPASLSFTIQESETVFIESQFQPHVAGTTDTLYADLGYTDTSVRIDNGTNTWSAGDVIWIAGREAVKLGTKVLFASTVYDYTSSTRGYLGTPQGKLNPIPIGNSAFTWDEDTTFYDHNRFLYNRRVILLAHVPGEADASYLYFGRLRNYGPVDGGVKWTFNTVGDTFVGEQGVRTQASEQYVEYITYLTASLGDANKGGQPVKGGGGTGPHEPDRWKVPNMNDGVENYLRVLNFNYQTSGDSDKLWEKYALAFQYNYRCVKGGTVGVKTAIDLDSTEPQAYTVGDFHRLDILCNIEGRYIKLLKQSTDDIDFRYLYSSSTDWGSETGWSWKGASPVKFMLDNYAGVWPDNRYCVNKEPRYNVIDFLLIHMTTMNSEFYIGDDAGGTASAIDFTAPGWTTNEWTGYALHCVEGDNQGYAREILSNDTDTIVVKEAFPSAPSVGDEYQIRNSIYDVLPLGWGLSIHNTEIDIAGCEEIKKKYFNGVEIGKFAIGDTSGFNTWDLLLENVCRPFGILVYRDRTNGKISMQHVGETVPDELIDTYVSIDQDDFLDEGGVGDIRYGTQTPLYEIALNVRETADMPLRPKPFKTYWGTSTDYAAWNKAVVYEPVSTVSSVGIDGPKHTITIKPEDSEVVYNPDLLDSMEFHAMFNSLEDATYLQTEMVSRLNRNRIPYPIVTIRLTTDFIVGNNAVQAGTLISMTDTTKYNPIDPFSGGRGWAGMIGRVLSSNFILSGSGIGLECEVALLEEHNAAKIAPACDISDKNNDGNGDYLIVAPVNFVDSVYDDRDYYYFAVGDKIEIRNKDGSVLEGGHEIAGFGTNFVSDPTQANSDRIYVTGTIVLGVTPDKYVTLEDWSNSNSDNMDDCFALADANEQLGAGNDPGKELT